MRYKLVMTHPYSSSGPTLPFDAIWNRLQTKKALVPGKERPVHYGRDRWALEPLWMLWRRWDLCSSRGSNEFSQPVNQPLYLSSYPYSKMRQVLTCLNVLYCRSCGGGTRYSVHPEPPHPAVSPGRKCRRHMLSLPHAISNISRIYIFVDLIFRSCEFYMFILKFRLIVLNIGSVVGWGTILQAGRSRVRFLMRSLTF
jgi:hypothetical protein